MTNTHCIFCGNYREKSKEHILPKWLQVELMGSTKGPFAGTHIIFPWPTPVDERKHSGESLVFGNVCKSCNNGWMNDFEVEAKPLLLDVINNNSKAKPWFIGDISIITK